MTHFFKRIGKSISQLANSINGTPADETMAHEPQPTPVATQSEPKSEPASKPSNPFDNAIDRRDIAIKALLNEFRQATGSSSQALGSLHIYVVTDKEDYDVKKYAWADDTLKQQLRLELDNAMLGAVGRKKLELHLVTAENLPEKAHQVVNGALYYSLVSPSVPVAISRARITVVEGTGSLEQPEYILDSTGKKSFNVGRGKLSATSGAYHTNDIVVREADSNPEIQDKNNHVSSAHAVIVATASGFSLRALPRGCRPRGGASTKIVYDGEVRELRDTVMAHPLNDGTLIELGRNVVLQFNTL